MPAPPPTPRRPTGAGPCVGVLGLLACLDCGLGLEGAGRCPGCGRAYPESGGIVEAMGPLVGRNRVAADFYDGPAWQRFRPWERLFLRLQGGKARARRQVLRHLDAPPFARVLEVGIGDGENLALLPRDWSAYGVDIARIRLEECQARDPSIRGRLALAEAEKLPFEDASFDACWTMGGFNYFSDRHAALREMRRVTRPGGTLIVADELPTLHRLGIGHLVGIKGLDRAWMGALGLPPDFIAMVFAGAFDVDAVVRRAWPDARRSSIWGGSGYCYSYADTRTDAETRSRGPRRSPA